MLPSLRSLLQYCPSSLFTVLLLGIILSACSSESAGSGEPAGYTVRDSAGVSIVESTEPAWSEGQGWTLSAEPTLSIGSLDGPEEYNLYRSMGALRLDDGRIVVANGGTNELRFFGPDGEFLNDVGGEGEGPGEFRGMAGIYRLGPDSLAVLDFRLFRFSIFDGAGAFAENLRVAEGGADLPFPHGFFRDGTILASIHASDSGDYTELGVIQRPVTYHRYEREGALLTDLTALPGQAVYRGVDPEGTGFTFSPGHSVRPFAAVGASTWFWGPGDAYEVQEWSMEGQLLKISRIDREPRPMPQELISEWEEQIRALPPDAAIMRRAIPLPEFLPAHEEILVDPIGNVWMSGYEVLDEDPKWQVFDSFGRWLGEVTVPAGGRITEVGADYLVGVWRDDLDVETVRVYGLHKPGMEG